MDDQTLMVGFEAMRKSTVTTAGSSQPGSGGGSGGGAGTSRRQLLINHAELGRQCKAVVRGFEVDSRMVASELRRQRKVGFVRNASRFEGFDRNGELISQFSVC